jgi:proteasome accessory factor A
VWTSACSGSGTPYCLSRRSGQAGILPAAAARSRPLISTFDEPRAGAELRRLRVSISDPAMSETTTLLRAGATFLVLRMAEAGTVMPDLRLENPVRAKGEVSQDITGRSLLRLAGGRQISALDIQRESLAKGLHQQPRRGVRQHPRPPAVGTGTGRDRDREPRRCRAGDRLGHQVPAHRAAPAEHALPLSAPEIAQADLAYHDIHRSHGLYYQLERSGAVERTARDVDIFEAKTVPPPHGRYREAG